MFRQFITAQHLQPTATIDDYGEEIATWSDCGNIEIAITVLNGSKELLNDVITANSTHLGLTKNNSIQIGDRIVSGITYDVNYITTGTRYNQLYLSAVEQI